MSVSKLHYLNLCFVFSLGVLNLQSSPPDLSLSGGRLRGPHRPRIGSLRLLPWSAPINKRAGQTERPPHTCIRIESVRKCYSAWVCQFGLHSWASDFETYEGPVGFIALSFRRRRCCSLEEDGQVRNLGGPSVVGGRSIPANSDVVANLSGRKHTLPFKVLAHNNLKAPP